MMIQYKLNHHLLLIYYHHLLEVYHFVKDDFILAFV